MKRLVDFARRWRVDRTATLVAALVLLMTGLLMAIFNESAYSSQKEREIGVQAQILSASVAPALMFDNAADAQDYLRALSANPDLDAAAVYNARGVRIAAFHRSDSPEPPPRETPQAARFENNRLITTSPVVRDGENLGAVYLRTNTDSLARRLSRYVGIGVLVILAALVFVVLGAAQGALSKANSELRDQAKQLRVQIDEREKAEEALLQSRKMEAIGQLTGGVAHDFNNLLMVVISGLRMLDRHSDPERRAKTMEAMRQAVERGAGLTRQLLAFSRRQTLSLEAVDVARQVNGMRELLERSLRADVLVDMALPSNLWPVKTDPAQLELAVLNLAVNGRDAMPKGGVLTITAENVTAAATPARPGGDYVEISVSDTGMGIPQELIDRVFEPYFTTKQTGQGTGLGLSQVYGFVSQSGGAVHIHSVVDQGTRITLSLPRSEIEASAPAPAMAPLEQRATVGGKVLVVEDDDKVADLVCEMLIQLGHKPTRVAHASAALGILSKSGGYDLVFSDIIMPGGMNGIELARAIRQQNAQLPIVLTTGYSGGSAITAEFPVLRKPYQIEELAQTLTAALRREAAVG
jgi:signal transduction histidine kinase